eukprot:scaffold107222_cov18-Prasinocladus_malaysianus.AAC.1
MADAAMKIASAWVSAWFVSCFLSPSRLPSHQSYILDRGATETCRCACFVLLLSLMSIKQTQC